MIDRGLIEDMFANMRAAGQWNLDGPLLWGFFFTAKDRGTLENASALLGTDGYRFVDVFVLEKEDPSDPDVWCLHVERVEHLTIDALDRRNRHLCDFAASLGLDSYDGMDVGPVGG